MTDNLKLPAPARFYGFACDRTGPEYFNVSKVLEERACTEAFAGDEAERACTEVSADGEAECACTEVLAGDEAECACTEVLAGDEAECAPSTSTEVLHVPGDAQTGLPGRRNDTAPEATASGAREIKRAREIVEPGRSVPAASPQVQAVIEAILAQPPLDQLTPEPEPIKKRKPRKKKRPRPKTVDEEPPVPALTMHEAHCKICASNLREELDEEFVDWHSVATIANAYRFDRHAVYRHAHATGLFAIRDRNLRRALGLIIHRAETARNITGDTVIRAVRTLAHINDSGEWVNPPTHVIVSSGAALQANATAPSPQRTDLVRSPACPDEGREQSRGAEPSSPELLDTPGRVKNELKP